MMEWSILLITMLTEYTALVCLPAVVVLHPICSTDSMVLTTIPSSMLAVGLVVLVYIIGMDVLHHQHTTDTTRLGASVLLAVSCRVMG